MIRTIYTFLIGAAIFLAAMAPVAALILEEAGVH